MAKLSSFKLNESNTIKAKELFESGKRFSILGARKTKGQLNNQVAFKIVLNDAPTEERTLYMAENERRLRYVDVFEKNQNVIFENCYVTVAENPRLGQQPAFLFEQDEEEAAF